MPVDAGGRAVRSIGFMLLLLELPIFLSVGLVVPWFAVVGLLAVWVGAAVLAVSRRDRPGIVLALPVGALVVLVLTVSLGEALFGWSA